MKAQDIKALIKSLQAAKTLEEQREAVKEISKIVNKKTEEEKSLEAEEKVRKSKERTSGHNRKDLLPLSTLTKMLGKTDIQFFHVETEEGDKGLVKFVRKPHVRDVARIKSGKTKEEWEKLSEEEKSALIKEHGKFTKELVAKFKPVQEKLMSRKGFNASTFRVTPDAEGITYTSEVRKEKK